MKKINLTILLYLLAFYITAQNLLEVESPSGNLSANIKVEENHANINLSAKNKYIAQIKTLQFSLEKNSIEGDWLITGNTILSEDQTWAPVYGERNLIVDRYNELIISLTSSVNQKEMNLYIRMYDEGLAVRYEFNELDFWNNVLLDEQTVFLFEKDYKTWASVNAQGLYAESRLSQLKNEVDRPLVIEANEGYYVAVGEAALVDYSRMKLKSSITGYGVQSALSGKVNLDLANYISPWRYVMVGESAGELVENNYFLMNLNEPNQIENTSWIKPGKVIREVTLTTEGGFACVDFAIRNQIEYIEFDAGWYGAENAKESDASTVTLDPARSKGPLDLQKVIDYANQNGVGVILYVNMIALDQQLDQILPLYKKWGVKGVKYGFVHVGNQHWTAWLHHAVRKAAKYELMVDIHDEYRPTGYSRTYPNLITQEGIRGDEESPSLEQTLYTLFARMIAGAGDYTNCFFAPRVSSEKMGGKAAQIAKAIAIYSPWQFIYWYDRPEESPRKAGGAGSTESIIKEDKITAFYSHIPTVWDDTKILKGDIGKYAVVARKSGQDWYIGALNAKEKQNITLSLDFLDKGVSYEAVLYYQTATDKKKNQVNSRKINLQKERSLSFLLEENSGAAIHVYKIY